MTYHILPTANAPRLVFLLDAAPDGMALHARVEIRYLSAPDQWVISIRDQVTDELLINQIPLICSYGKVNDLLLPFRHMRQGRGLGSLFVLKKTDEPSTPDPFEKNLGEFMILWGDTYDAAEV